ncbi:hypothetical protein PNOK_0867800 [Pyrrhoderma noxium]|uniref:DUF6534 domain-containing protein n=1 Tax=Pyrrhoderma noxium TaxID=2282107 RepID=A0A286U8C0_9AGAM|nr:hypothetical protein PNOK_0867800 [Pyrrhoderma noxium]
MSSGTNIQSLDDTMGALFIGVLFSMALWGAGTVQIYYYYNEYQKDRLFLKLMVLAVWVFDTVHQGLIMKVCYNYLITHWGDANQLNVLDQSLILMVLFTALICLIVQSFFSLRIWRLSEKNILLTGFVYIWVIAQFVITIVYFSQAIYFDLFSQLLEIKTLTRSINVISATADAVIAGVLVYLLRRSRTGYRRSERMIVRLIRFTVGTGAVTGFIAIICLIMNLVFPLTFYYILFYLMTSRLYMNSLLATLNARNGVLNSFGDTLQSVITTGIAMDRFRTPTSAFDTANARSIAIKIDAETGPDDSFKNNTSSATDQESIAYTTNKADLNPQNVN